MAGRKEAGWGVGAGYHHLDEEESENHFGVWRRIFPPFGFGLRSL